MDITTDTNADITTALSTESSTVADTTLSTAATTIISTIVNAPTARSLLNSSLVNISQPSHNESQFVLPVFEGFIVTEILMTALELMIALIAAYKISGWRSNYRNQMLMQLSAARFIKRLIAYVKYLNIKGVVASSSVFQVVSMGSQIYIDYVISILVCFFIKHIYDSLIIMIVKISRGNLLKVLLCSWLIPIPISAMWTSIIATGSLDKWLSYLLVCGIFRWPVMVVSTIMYIIVVYRVLIDDVRRYARSLTIVTFFLCLFVNFYLLFGDVIELWCLKTFLTILVSYVLGFCLNSLILCLYIIIIILNINSNRKQSNSNVELYKADDVEKVEN